MSATTDALTAIRDAAHLNQHALDLVATEAQEQFDAIRQWPDSPLKVTLLKVLGHVIASYNLAHSQALNARDAAGEALATFDQAVPPLPATGAEPQWSREDW